MGEIISDAKFFIDYSGGNYQLKRVDTLDISFEADKTIVTAIGVPQGAGYRKQKGGGGLQLEVFPETGKPEVDYLKLFFSDELFRFVIQEEPNGQRFQAREVTVKKPPGRKYNSKGEVMITVELGFLKFGAL